MFSNLVLNGYDRNAFMTSFFKGNLVTHEAVMFVDSADGYNYTEKKLLYPIDKVISLRNNKLDKEYVEGIDFSVKDGKLIWLPDGECPIWRGNLTVSTKAEDSFVDPALNVGTSGNAAGWYRLDSDGDRGLNLIFDGYHENKTVYVTYKHSKIWADLGEDGFNPQCIENNRNKTQKFLDKISMGEDINVLVYGDSTATGESSTGFNVNYDLFSALPNENGDYAVMRENKKDGVNAPAFFELATEEIVEKRGKGNKINYYNIACGGKDASWGNKNLLQRVDFMNKYYGKTVNPNIIYIKFMANDVRTPVDSYKASMENIVQTFRKLYKDALIVLVSGKINNEKCYIFRESRDNVDKLQNALCEIEKTYDNCITAKVTPVFKEIIKCKDYEDYLSNNINHGNDFWARVVAQCIAESVL